MHLYIAQAYLYLWKEREKEESEGLLRHKLPSGG